MVALFVLFGSPISGQHVKDIKFHRSSFCLGRLCFRRTGITSHTKANKVAQSRYYVLALYEIAFKFKETWNYVFTNKN